MVENPEGVRQKVKSIVELKVGEYCLTQQNVVVQKIDRKYVNMIIKILNKGEKSEKE